MLRRILFLSLHWICFQSVISAQADSILALPKHIQVQAFWATIIPPKEDDSVLVNHQLEGLERDFKKQNALLLSQQAWLGAVFYNAIYRNVYRPVGITIINAAIEEAHQRKWRIPEGECMLMKGIIYYRQNRFGPGFEFLQKGYQILKSEGLANCPNITFRLQEMGQCYYEFGDYEGTIDILREAIDVTTSQEHLRANHTHGIYNMLALSYQKLESYDSAIYYFKKSHDAALEANNTFWAALANGNLGNIYYVQGRYDKAIPLMEKDFDESKEAFEYGSAVNAAQTLATMYLKKGETDKAFSYLQYARQNINYADPRALSGFYKNLSTFSRIKGDHEQAYAYMDSFLVYSDKVKKINDTRIINQAQLKVEVEQHGAELRLLEAKRSRQILLRNGLLAIVLLSGVIAFLYFNRQRLKRLKELELADLKTARAEDELRNAQKELSAFTNTLKEKNELIESFRQELELMNQSGQAQNEDRTAHLTQLLNSTILTEEDWKSFRMLFDKVHPGFFIRLKEKMSDLSPADTRLMALTKLQLAPKEMAAMLGLTYEAIKKSRQRLRKKINLPEEGSLDEVVEMI